MPATTILGQDRVEHGMNLLGVATVEQCNIDAMVCRKKQHLQPTRQRRGLTGPSVLLARPRQQEEGSQRDSGATEFLFGRRNRT